MERWFEAPQAAAGPEVTPTKPIFKVKAESTDFSDEIGEEIIVDRIFEAVVEQRLPAGTKLSESALCDAFGVGRMRIRRALLHLASREIGGPHPN